MFLLKEELHSELIIKEECEEAVDKVKDEDFEQSSVFVFSISCDLCEFTTDNSPDLHKHNEAKHPDSKYSCNQCRYSTWDRGDLIKQ